MSLIRSAGSTRLANNPDWSFFTFAAMDCRFVMRDIFLDGNTFTDSHEVNKENFVGDFAAGLSFSYKGLMLTWSQILRSKKFDQQLGHHSFGSVMLSVFYPFQF